MKKVVVIGGGFAGAYLARNLGRKFDVLLIDSKDYFEFTPSILRAIAEKNFSRKIRIRHKEYLRGVKVRIGEVREVGKDYIIVGKNRIRFDYLAICSGSSYSFPIKESNLIMADRGKHLEEIHKEVEKAKTMLVIGGGPAGVELAAEIVSHYDKKVTLVHSGERILDRAMEESSSYASSFLEKRGVETILSERIIGKKGRNYFTEKGRKIESDIAFLCIGAKANSSFMEKQFYSHLNKKGQIKVTPFLNLEGFDHIFAAGDVNSTCVEKTAQNAERQAKIVLQNINALEKGMEMREYSMIRTPMLISLGKWDGILEGNRFFLKGIIPAFLKSLVEKIEMWKLRI